MRSQKGFTLIEVLASLLIVGIMAAIAGMGIVTGTRGYLQTKENAHLAQKGQVAMNRVNRELMELTGIVAVDTVTPYIIFDNPVGRQALERSGANLRLHQLSAVATDLSGSTGDILTDQVAALTINYFKGPQPWVFGENIDLLSAINVGLDLQRREGTATTVTFSTTIQPRNTNNFGGVPPDSTEPQTLRQYGCFVTTAAGAGSRPPRVSNDGGPGWWPALLPAAALAAAMRRTGRRRRARRAKVRICGQGGNVLVGLVVTMLVFAALAAGMVSMTATSTTSQVASNNTSRAYYVAESGFRYAASRYLNALDGNGRYGSEDEKNAALEAMHTQSYTLGGDGGQFQVEVYPWYLTVAGDHILSSTVLQSKFSGGPPAGFNMPTLGSTAKLSINGNIYTYFTYNAGSGVFNSLSPALLEPVYDNALIRPVGIPSTSIVMSKNGTLPLAYGFFFPEISGKFRIQGVTYTYKKRAGNVLTDITDANDPDRAFSISVSPSTDVIVEPFLQVRATGSVGQGELTATREIVYNTPLPGDPEKPLRAEYYNPFDDDQDMAAATYGSFAIGDAAGDSALKVTGLSTSNPLSPSAALIATNSTKLNVNFASAHRFGGQFLSYDAQAKIGIDEPLTPDLWSDPDPDTNAPDGFPKYFAAGIAFRLDQNLNTYGIGFMRGSNNWSPTPDDIEPDLMPVDHVPIVTLWQQTDNNTDRDWLAYAVLPGSIIFADDGESGNLGWSANTAGDGAEWTLATNRANSGQSAWTTSPTGSYGGYAGSYVDGDNITLTSPQFDLSTYDSAVLSFWTWYRIYSSDDYGIVQVCNGTCALPGDWTTLDSYTSNSHDLSGDIDGWVKIAFDLSSYTGAGMTSVKIRFLFDRDNDPGKTRNGWWIDDIRISTKKIVDFHPNGYATLMVRVIEAAVIDFTSGGTAEIEAGDLVTQPSGASGRVIFKPILDSGTWAGGNAAGMIWLNRTSATPFAGGAINVPGKGNDLATAVGYKERTNLIKAYINSASTIDTGPPNDNGYDLLRLANPRGTLRWPADEGELTDATNDHFTLLEWDIDINYSIPTIQRLRDENGRYTIIASDDPDLFTPPDTYFPFDRPELGLFALGHGGIRAYFDDLGVQLYMTTGAGFLTPVQQ